MDASGLAMDPLEQEAEAADLRRSAPARGSRERAVSVLRSQGHG